MTIVSDVNDKRTMTVGMLIEQLKHLPQGIPVAIGSHTLKDARLAKVCDFNDNVFHVVKLDTE